MIHLSDERVAVLLRKLRLDGIRVEPAGDDLRIVVKRGTVGAQCVLQRARLMAAKDPAAAFEAALGRLAKQLDQRSMN